MDDVELRYKLLEKAQGLLISEWEHKVKVEDAGARFESRPPAAIRQPTLHRVMVLAEKFYGFVKSPPLNPTNPIAPSSPKPAESSGSPVSEDAPDAETMAEDVDEADVAEDLQDASEDEGPEDSSEE
jgi:hypothetical protein